MSSRYSYSGADFCVPSTPEEVESDDDFDDFKTPANFSNMSSQSNYSDIQRSAIQESIIDESRNEEEEESVSSTGTDDEVDQTQEESFVQKDVEESYQVRRMNLVSGEDFDNGSEPEESFIAKDWNRKNINRSPGENSAEHSAAENLDDNDSNVSNESLVDSGRISHSPEDSFQLKTTKKASARKAIISSDESSPEPTPQAERQRDTHASNKKETAKKVYSRNPNISSDESSPEPTPRVERQRDRHSRNGSEDSVELESDDERSPRNVSYGGRRSPTVDSNASTEEEQSRTVDSNVSTEEQSRTLDSNVTTEEENTSLNGPTSHRIQTPRLIQDSLLKTSIDRGDSGMDTVGEEGLVKSPSSDDNSLPLPVAETDVQDLSSSILDISSTHVSFASFKEQDNSIEEVSSPEVQAIAQPIVLSEAEIAKLRRELHQKQLIARSSDLSKLPDGGMKLRGMIRSLKETLEEAEKNYREQPLTAERILERQETEIREKLQVKKWALGNAAPDQKERLRTEIVDMERSLIQLSIANATSSASSSRPLYKPLELSGPTPAKSASVKVLPDFPELSDIKNELQARLVAEKKKATKFLPEVPKLTDTQRKMFSDQPSKELYKKTDTGYISAAARREAVSVTLDSLENLHHSLKSCPGESEKEPTPSCLTVPLMPHQERALKWLLWRETQNPAGGILADDMGLGKTLTMISLVVRQKELDPVPTGSSDVWLSKTVKIKRSTGTLVVCPASVVGQWENEIKRRCKRNTLSILVFHGPDRNKYASKLHQFDVVITTYQIVAREIPVSKTDGDSNPIGDYNGEREIRQSILLQIAFDRIILDEAHVIRNPKSGVSQSVCRLRAVRRWAVTGTPVQNKELDMYSLLRFLRVSPFDQLAVWKRWVDSSKAQGADQAADRLQLLIKTLLLRRTKDQKSDGSDVPLVSMPSREVHTHNIQLSKEENEVYQQLLTLSRKVLEDYIKNMEKKLGDQFSYDRSALSNTPAPDKNQVLVLLLRLRQVCSHPALIKTMLDANDADALGSEDAAIEEDDVDLISKMSTMTLDGNQDKTKEEKNAFFTHTNPVFDQEIVSSKMKYISSEVKKVLDLGEKAVVVSQWTSMLNLFAQHFSKLRIRCHMIAGNVPLKQRTIIVEDFNTNKNGKPVMLLSLGAGGVGLNLIGANHLFVADMHWNPQLEAQACDRIYRVGQKKDVHVHRILTEGTVEERILMVQENKLKMANGILTGAAKLATRGLTLDDLKMIFNPGPPAYVPKANLNLPNVDPY